MDERTTLLVRTHLDSVNLVDEYQKLQAENEQLKKDLEHARSYKRRIKMRSRALQADNERLKGELQQSATNCNKLKCLALHAMRDLFCVYMANEYFNIQDRKDEEGKARAKKLYEKFAHLRDKYNDAYRKAKKALREGK